MKNNERMNGIEAFITVVILFVVIHTFLEDFATLAGWGERAATVLMIAGFCFDLFFTLEFLIRLGLATRAGRPGEYFLHRKGWIDFLASVPLLLLNSGPAFMIHILGGGVFAGVGGILSILKLIKAIRIARVLRLLRVLKVFRNIKYTDSAMAQRHVAKIITIGITSLVFSLLLMNFLKDLLDLPGTHRAREVQQQAVVELAASRQTINEQGSLAAALDVLSELNPVLIVKRGGETLYTRYTQSYYDDHFAYEDYDYLKSGEVEVFFDLREENRLQTLQMSTDSLVFYIIVLSLVIAYLLIYSPHFALTVSDPIYVMQRGLAEPSYNLNVKIPPRYAEDDVYRLSRLYNENYLPMKDLNRASEEDAVSSELSLSDYQDLIEGEDFQ